MKEGEAEFLRQDAPVPPLRRRCDRDDFDETGQADTYARKTEIPAARTPLTEQLSASCPRDTIFDPAAATGIEETR